MRVLAVEDEPDLLSSLIKALREDGYAVDGAPDGEEGLYKAESYDYDAIVLDIMLPGIDGWELLRRLRKTKKTPVLMLTARDAVRDRVRGLDTGADDYLVKPFELAELLARLRALIRRSGRSGGSLSVGDLTLDPDAHTVTKNGEAVSVSKREFDVLRALMEGAGRVLTRSQLEQSLYGWNRNVDSNAVEVHIHNLRLKLGATALRTVRGVGYTIAKSGS